jgi:hypothetical protein
MKTALFRGIYHSNELRSLLLKNQALSGGAGASSGGVECEKKAKVVGWRKRYVFCRLERCSYFCSDRNCAQRDCDFFPDSFLLIL